MHQIAILNYTTCTVEIIDVSPATWQQYAEDLDALVYGVWGYKQSEIYYMSGKDGIEIVHNTETSY